MPNANFIPFTKIEGAGNDFVLFDCRSQNDAPVELVKKVPQICDRHFGIGADGVLFVCNSERSAVKVIYFNADGSRSVCGNGTRCVASFVYRHSDIDRGVALNLETDYGEVIALMAGDASSITVNMGAPEFEGTRIPTAIPGEQIRVPLTIGTSRVELTAVSMGNPHAVIFVDKLEDVDFGALGAALECHSFFPARTNVEFVEVLRRNEVRMKVWERGVGPTLACGTGNCAVLAAGVREGRLDKQLTLHAPGGTFELSWETDGIKLTGPAREVFSGQFDLTIF